MSPALSEPGTMSQNIHPLCLFTTALLADVSLGLGLTSDPPLPAACSCGYFHDWFCHILSSFSAHAHLNEGRIRNSIMGDLELLSASPSTTETDSFLTSTVLPFEFWAGWVLLTTGGYTFSPIPVLFLDLSMLAGGRCYLFLRSQDAIILRWNQCNWKHQILLKLVSIWALPLKPDIELEMPHVSIFTSHTIRWKQIFGDFWSWYWVLALLLRNYITHSQWFLFWAISSDTQGLTSSSKFRKYSWWCSGDNIGVLEFQPGLLYAMEN